MRERSMIGTSAFLSPPAAGLNFPLVVVDCGMLIPLISLNPNRICYLPAEHCGTEI